VGDWDLTQVATSLTGLTGCFLFGLCCCMLPGQVWFVARATCLEPTTLPGAGMTDRTINRMEIFQSDCRFFCSQVLHLLRVVDNGFVGSSEQMTVVNYIMDTPVESRLMTAWPVRFCPRNRVAIANLAWVVCKAWQGYGIPGASDRTRSSSPLRETL
jgi:hypothetical protein